jgi:hypothetical protein
MQENNVGQGDDCLFEIKAPRRLLLIFRFDGQVN